MDCDGGIASCEATSIIDLLASGQPYVGVPFGISMWPMLRNKRDMIVIRGINAADGAVKPDGATKLDGAAKPGAVPNLQKGTVALFIGSRNRLVLHRIIKVTPEGYLFQGDNCAKPDGVIPPDRVIGILEAYYRDGEKKSLDSRGYRTYVAAWAFLRPIRGVRIRVYSRLVWLYRYAGEILRHFGLRK